MKFVLLISFAAVTAFTYWLRHLNLRHLKQYGTIVPDDLTSVISQETLSKSSAYTLDSSRLGLWESLFDNGMLLLFLFGGVLPYYDRFIAGFFGSSILQGVLFFLIITWVQTILELPFSIYGTFVVEARHGFNTMTPRIWFSDLLKSQAIGSLLLAVIIAAIFWLIQWSPERWWVLVWAFMAFFGLFMMFISPYVIEPLFNRYDPVSEEGLQSEIEAMMSKAGLKVGKVMQMDASKRSRHSNAYFTGIGKVKRIVLFDTLIKQMTHDEIIAVLAHEIGHWKLRHIVKRITVLQVFMLIATWSAFHLVQGDLLPTLLGLTWASLPARLMILGFIASMAMFPLTPLSSWLSRRHEYQADRFACELTGNPGALASALIKLSAENLANLHPHPLYARFYYSHPPIVERVAALRLLSETAKSSPF